MAITPTLLKQAAAMARGNGVEPWTTDQPPAPVAKPAKERDPSIPLAAVVAWHGRTENGAMFVPLRKTIRPEGREAYQIVIEVGEALLVTGYEEVSAFWGGAGMAIVPLGVNELDQIAKVHGCKVVKR